MMTLSQLLGGCILSCFFLVALVYFTFLKPPRQPHGIPAIPFWVALIPLFRDVDQEDIFREYIDKPLRKHGAVKIFFGSQWNVLVHRPRYLSDVFKNEDEYQKSGNHKKIPHSVLGSFLGENIISSHGDVWKTFQEVMKPGLQQSFDQEMGILFGNAHRLCEILVESQSKSATASVLVQEILQRYTIANFAQTFFDADFGTLQSSDAYINRLQSSIKRQIFKPIFMNFPFLDQLHLPSREETRRLAAHFKDQLVAAVEGSVLNGTKLGPTTKLGTRLMAARQSKQMTEKQFRDNVTISFVAGQENPQLALLSMLYLLAKNPAAQERLFNEFTTLDTDTDEPGQQNLQELPFLAAVVLECLRLLPPLGQIINRRAAIPMMLDDGVFIPQGTYLGYNCYSTNRNPEAWGPDADQFRPQRWGDTFTEIQKTYRRRRSRSEFITFHGGRRACLGEKFALLELKATLFVLCRELRWKLDPTWADKLTPAGPICPRALRLVVEKRKC